MTRSSDETIRLGDRLRSTEMPDRGSNAGALLVVARGGTCAVERDGVVIAGRDPECELAIDDGSLSRRHARFSCDKNVLHVEDLASTNGTVVNGVPLAAGKVQALAVGDEVRLGEVRVTVAASAGGARGVLVSHERFVAALDDEIARARVFVRPCALALVRVVGGAASSLVAAALAQLRSVDRVALYGDDVLELLLCEMSGDAAAKLVASIAPDTKTASAVAAFPEDATAADALVAAALASLEAGQGAVRRAPSQAHKLVSGAVGAKLVAASTAMQTLLATVDKVAKTVIPVLLVGETGSGKEVAARLIHERSPRNAKPLVAVNCGAIPPTLVESTLFGHEKGAFTGATDARQGVFEAAHGGTVFLDEIGELPSLAQTALLRVLETRTITRVGATAERAVDVRVVAATHRDLDEMVARGTFRQDLLYRLNAMTVAVPPLRERKDEALELAARFLVEANARHGRSVQGLSDDARELITTYAWPGNIRELKNAIERAVVIASGELVDVDDLPESMRSSAAPPASSGSRGADGNSGISLGEALEKREIELILEALARTKQSVADAAVALQLPKRTLQHRMKLLGIQRKAGYSR